MTNDSLKGLSLGLLRWGIFSEAWRCSDLWVVSERALCPFWWLLASLFLPMSIGGRKESDARKWAKVSELGKHLNYALGTDLGWTVEAQSTGIVLNMQSHAIGSLRVCNIVFKCCIANQICDLCREACWQCKKLLHKMSWDCFSCRATLGVLSHNTHRHCWSPRSFMSLKLHFVLFL